jgi:hypothetical protein
MTVNFFCKGSKEKFTMKVEDFYMPSGWRLTSSLNFFNELGGTLSVITPHPEYLFLTDKQGEMLVEKGEFKHCYPTYFEGGRRAKIDLKVEGDDVGGRVSAFLADHQQEIEENYKQLGYSSKLKFVKDGRLEMIGVHFTMVNGCTSPKVPWMPDFYRTMCKMGVCASTAIDKQAAVASRFCSFACMFLSRNEAIANMFYNFAVQTAQTGSVLVDVHQDVIAAGLEGEEVGKRHIRCDLESILDYTRRSIRNANYPDTIIRRKMLENSLEANITADEFTELESYCASVAKYTLGGDFITHMPAAFVDKVPLDIAPPEEATEKPWVPLTESPFIKDIMSGQGQVNDVDSEANESSEEDEPSGSQEC